MHTIWQFALHTVTSISEWNKITKASPKTLQWNGVHLQNLSHNISNMPKSQSLKEPIFTLLPLALSKNRKSAQC